MDRFLVNPRPKPQPKPKPTNLMEEVISIKHDEGVVENPCLYRVAREWAGPTGSDRSPSPGPRLNGSLSQKLLGGAGCLVIEYMVWRIYTISLN